MESDGDPTPSSAPEPSPNAAQGPSGLLSTLRKALVPCLVGLCGLALVFQCVVSHPAGDARGEIRSSGPPMGDFLVQPVTCVTGRHWGFDGVWVTTKTLTSGRRRGFRGGLKLVRGADGGWDAVVENPDACEVFTCRQSAVNRTHCRQYDVAVSDRNMWLRRRGHARIGCAFPGGGTLDVDVSFEGCAEVKTSGGEP
jgi:hypothetical protein